MNADRVKHLEMLQAIIARMARCSFAYKGWAITIVAGILALSAKQADYRYLIVALLPTLAFWGLDAYYLRQEWLYRQLYGRARLSSQSDWERDPFSMDTGPFIDAKDERGRKRTWGYYVRSRTIAWLYFPMAVAVILATVLAFISQGCGGGC